jgi:hypothetical protein
MEKLNKCGYFDTQGFRCVDSGSEHSIGLRCSSCKQWFCHRHKKMTKSMMNDTHICIRCEIDLYKCDCKCSCDTYEMYHSCKCPCITCGTNLPDCRCECGCDTYKVYGKCNCPCMSCANI